MERCLSCEGRREGKKGGGPQYLGTSFLEPGQSYLLTTLEVHTPCLCMQKHQCQTPAWAEMSSLSDCLPQDIHSDLI